MIGSGQRAAAHAASHTTDQASAGVKQKNGDADEAKSKVGAFSLYDADGSGRLEALEAGRLMVALGLNSSVWEHFDSDHDGAISKDGFDRLEQDSSEFKESDSDGSGFLEAGEVGKIMSSAG